MITVQQIDYVAAQLAQYADLIPDIKNNPITRLYESGTSVTTDITLLSYLCDQLVGVLAKEHNVVSLIATRLKLIELKRCVQQDAQAEAVRYADELLTLLTDDIAHLNDATKEKALTLLTRYKLTKSMSALV